MLQKFGKERNRYDTGREKDGRNPKNIMHQACDQYAACCFDDSGECSDKFTDGFRMGRPRINVINLKRILNGKQNVWKYQNGEEKSDSDGREKDV